MYQLLEARERVEVGKLREPVFCEDEGLQVRYARGEVWLNVRYAVLSEEQCAEARLEGEVAELRDIVVGEVNCIVVLRIALVAAQERSISGGLARAAPMFSMAEILWPRIYDIDINSARKCSICSFQRTSQIEFTLRETVDEGEGVVDQVRC
jgi:hypothetical protein